MATEINIALRSNLQTLGIEVVSGSAVREDPVPATAESYLPYYIMGGGALVVLVLSYFVVAHFINARRVRSEKETKVVPVGDASSKSGSWTFDI